ncbi:MAG: YIP1 family protein [Deltaproteobacteria bacterium]|nr:YIP1 family protein [Deltaproteobacteria bacterium]
MGVRAIRFLTPLFDPIDGTSAAVAARTWISPLLAILLCSVLAQAAAAWRWDPQATVVQQLQEEGELKNATEAELSDKIETAGRMRLVGGVAAGLVGPLLSLLLLAVGIRLAAWLFDRRPSFRGCLAAAAIALLPLALYDLIYLVSALARPALTDAEIAHLVPSSLAALWPQVSPKALQALAAIDFFKLWSVALLGLAFATATGMRRRAALPLALVCYLLFSGASIGLTGLAGDAASAAAGAGGGDQRGGAR